MGEHMTIRACNIIHVSDVNEKILSRLIRPQKKKKKSVMATEMQHLHHMRKTRERFTQIISNQKILKFLCKICSLTFNGKQFLFFVERGKT
jgi:guanylate kinase